MLDQENIILLTDSYKLTHHVQDPPNTTHKYAYMESREGARFPNTVFFGLQALMMRNLEGCVVTYSKILDAKAFTDEHIGPGVFNEEGWLRIYHRHMGRLPVNIWAVPEGSVHPTGTPLMAIENTDPHCHWLPNALETLLTHVWYPSTVATLSREIKKTMHEALVNTGCQAPDEVIKFMLHDFAGRSFTSTEAQGMGGMAHLVNFQGTDTVHAITYAQRYYKANMPAFSVPASEHSTMTTWGEEGEADAYENMLDSYPTGTVSIVADSWDFRRAVDQLFGRVLKSQILARDGKTVIRPDSGNIFEENLYAARSLARSFGCTTTSTGHIKLHPKIGLLQGDGMSLDSVEAFFRRMADAGFAAENWVIGMGSGLMQGINRDTQRFAFKCSQAKIEGHRQDVFKRPATDPDKNSKRGRFDDLDLVFSNGSLNGAHVQTFASIRDRAAP